MGGFGDKLRREREMRGVSLEEIAESTKIGTRSLRALEQEDFEKLPGGIFNKGFVRAYSRFLGIDEDQALADFDAAWKEHEILKGPLPEVQLEAPEEPEARRIGMLASAVLILLAIAAAAYTFKHYRGSDAARQQPTLADAQQSSQPQPSPVSPPSAATSNNSQSGTDTANNALTPSDTETPATAAGSSAHNRATPPETPSADSRTAGATTAAPIRVQVFAREDSWLSVLADGKNLGQGVLTAQRSRTIRAQNELKLTVGNVGGVEVSFNGKIVNIDGAPKEVKELTFTPEGLRQ
ncbi:MAG TPA: RodZ domain-containing protein [Terriglobales bacterium]|nr:RodZ domain-containing protein [Terriglobales bacterium]